MGICSARGSRRGRFSMTAEWTEATWSAEPITLIVEGSTMSELKAFVEYLKSTGPPPTADSDQAAPTSGQAAPVSGQAASGQPPMASGQAAPAGPKTDAKRELADSVTKRLDKLYGPYKLA